MANVAERRLDTSWPVAFHGQMHSEAGPSTHKIRVLHLSDLHERQGPVGNPEVARKRGGEAFRRRLVLGEAWERNLAEVRSDGPVDLVCFTGDVADWGLAEEYAAVTKFVRKTLALLEVPIERFFVVPGNHDIQRHTNEEAWTALRTNLFLRRPGDGIDPRLFSRWMAGLQHAPRGLDEAFREQVLARSAAYWAWVESLGRPDLLPKASPHGTLGYRKTLRLDGRPFDLHVIGLDTAWLSGSMSDHDSDAGRLLLTENQIGKLTTMDDGGPLGGLRLVLMHHPLTDLADGSEARVLLARNVDLVLRGHLHEEALEEWVDPTQRLRQLAVGSLYEGDIGNRWPNACHLVEITVDDAGRPRRYDVRFRGWSTKKPHWFNDNSLYPGTVDGVLMWSVEGAAAPSLRPEPPPRVDVFIGRTVELAALENALLPATGGLKPVSIVALQGMPGVGKSYVADRFFANHAASFPGGLVRLVMRREDDRTADDLWGALADKLGVQVGEGIRDRLQEPRTLVHLENADTDVLGRAVVGVLERLPGCAVVVTGRLQGLGKSRGWAQVEVKPFGAADAVKQLMAEHPEASAEDRMAFPRLAGALGCLPLALSLAAAHLVDGRSVEGFLDLLHRKRLQVGPTDPSDARGTIAATFALSLELFGRHLGADAGRLLPAFETLGQAPLAGFGRSLGAAIAGLPPLEFEDVAVAARKLSMLLRVDKAERSDPAWRVHPLLAELLRDRAGAVGAFERMTAWFVERLPEPPAGTRWKEVHTEVAGLTEWLGRLDGDALVRVGRAGSVYAQRNGPFQAWMALCAHGLAQREDPAERSNLLWTLTHVARRGGAMDLALGAAKEKAEVDRARGDDHEAALAAGAQADTLHERGEFDEELRIRRVEELPVYERLGDELSRAVTRGKVATVLQMRGKRDEALRIRMEEELPVYERLGDVFRCALTLGNIADMLQAQGSLEDALRIRREVLQAYEVLGDVSARAITQSQIADILAARGQGDEAVRIGREEVLPVLERLGDVRAVLIARTKLAVIHLHRAHAGDREAAADLLSLALRDAERLRLPEAHQNPPHPAVARPLEGPPSR